MSTSKENNGPALLFFAALLCFAGPLALVAIFYTWYGGALLARHLGAQDAPAGLWGIFTVIFAVGVLLLVAGTVRWFSQGRRSAGLLENGATTEEEARERFLDAHRAVWVLRDRELEQRSVKNEHL